MVLISFLQVITDRFLILTLVDQYVILIFRYERRKGQTLCQTKRPQSQRRKTTIRQKTISQGIRLSRSHTRKHTNQTKILRKLKSKPSFFQTRLEHALQFQHQHRARSTQDHVNLKHQYPRLPQRQSNQIRDQKIIRSFG